MLNRKVTRLTRRERERCEAIVEILQQHTNGINVSTDKIKTAYYDRFNLTGTWSYGGDPRRRDLTKHLKLAAEHDMIDGDWVGSSYLWSLKPQDRLTVVA